VRFNSDAPIVANTDFKDITGIVVSFFYLIEETVHLKFSLFYLCSRILFDRQGKIWRQAKQWMTVGVQNAPEVVIDLKIKVALFGCWCHIVRHILEELLALVVLVVPGLFVTFGVSQNGNLIIVKASQKVLIFNKEYSITSSSCHIDSEWDL
jgi:hypothetical protein